MTTDLSAAPYALAPDQQAWVRDRVAAMPLEAKVGQMFVAHAELDDDSVALVRRFQLAGVRPGSGTADEVAAFVDRLNAASDIPLLVGANLEFGGDGAAKDGTLIGAPLQCVATGDTATAEDLGRVCAVEGLAAGTNWAFAPVADIHLNWRNSIASHRAFGDTAEDVAAYAAAYHRGAAAGAAGLGFATCAKHFPGDGVDERDQHLVATVNTLDAGEWRATFGRVYGALIEAGVPTIMVGHIAQPAITRQLLGDDAPIRPATLAPELATTLLRDELGFNGVTVTDATHMVGFTSQGRREDLLVDSVVAGCDLLLFLRDAEADVEAVLAGARDGRIAAERVDEAVTRVLALKVAMGLCGPGAVAHERPRVDRAVHRAIGEDVARRSATLVIDKGVLPLRPETHRRVRLIVNSELAGNAEFPIPIEHLPLTRWMAADLERRGFKVSFPEPLPPVRSLGDYMRVVAEGNVAVEGAFDAAVVVAHYVGGGVQSTVSRLRWPMALGPAAPWWAGQVPTVFVSFGVPTHLADVPMVGALVNCYTPSEAAVRAAVDGIVGAEPFLGTANANAWCGLVDVI
ncbi:glycoside hydrolase family 3 N-terminal domain-containing protein [Demequina soli]|uniref:glycoside hydrolase family 3 N-terminal domain-containing protein n=1 Tax=Demequina soli TaxID=1638987 RepID=UPI0007848B51|nr:glycoside hydrolase family 3 N-terminal domain-containing protein [Demequina soli]